MKHLDNFLAVFAFGLCTITIATFCMACAGWAYGVLGTYERELIAIASNPWHAQAVPATAASGSASGEEHENVVRLEPLIVIGNRSGAEEQPSRVARAEEAFSPNAPRGRS